METIDPRTMPRMLHVMPMGGKFRVRWSDGKKALRCLPDREQAIRYARVRANGVYAVMVHKPSGFVDVKRSIVLPFTALVSPVH